MHPESTSVYPREAVAHVQPRDSDGLAVKHWGLEGFHNDGLTGKNTMIAIIDSGINQEHDAFKGKIHPALKNFLKDPPNGDITDDNGHGTKCAGIAAGLPLVEEEDTDAEGSKPPTGVGKAKRIKLPNRSGPRSSAASVPC